MRVQVYLNGGGGVQCYSACNAVAAVHWFRPLLPSYPSPLCRLIADRPICDCSCQAIITLFSLLAPKSGFDWAPLAPAAALASASPPPRHRSPRCPHQSPRQHRLQDPPRHQTMSLRRHPPWLPCLPLRLRLNLPYITPCWSSPRLRLCPPAGSSPAPPSTPSSGRRCGRPPRPYGIAART